MAITAVRPFPIYSPAADTFNVSNIALDATGESLAVVGQLWIDGAPAGTKTLSAAGGGSVFFWTSTPVTLANGSSVFDVGLQDVSLTTGLEDGTFDVSGSWTSAAAPSSNRWNKKVMDTGTKTLSHLDLVAVVAHFTTRAGADSMPLRRAACNVPGLNTDFPYGTVDVGTHGKSTSYLMAAILFDDGTLGWILGTSVSAPTSASVSFNSGSTPDEYIATFTPQVPMQITAIAADVFNVAAADTFEMILYSDPLGTPAIVETVTPDTDVIGGITSTNLLWQKITPVTLTAGTVYGIAVRPTTANSISFGYFDLLASDNAVIKTINAFGTSAKVASRTNQTGAFTEVQTYYMPAIGILVTGLHDGAGGGGASAHTFIG